MDKRSLVRDYSLLVPLLIGIVSMLGIGLILISIWFPRESAETVPTQTETPFKYIWLASETAMLPPDLETAPPQEISSTPTAILPGDSMTPFQALTNQSVTSAGDVSTPTITITPNLNFNESPPMTIGIIYDNTDSHIIRSGDWVSQENAGVAYQGTLLVSNTVGNYIYFRFDGQQLIVGYQSDVDLGTVKITIDGVESLLSQSIDQSPGNEWISKQILQGTHLVIITHESGVSVNLDYIDIPN